MRTAVQALFRILLKAIGAIGILIFAAYLMAVVPGGAATRDLLQPVPIIAMGGLAVLSFALACFQPRLPVCLVTPHRARHAAVVLPSALVAGLLTALVIMVTLTGMGLPDTLQRSLSVNIGALLFCMYCAAGLVGTLLGLWPQVEPAPHATG